MNPNRIAIAMSGGVDSSVAAALLIRDGFEVVGVRFRFAAGTQREPEDEADARRVGERLGIEVRTVDRTAEFERSVVGRFVEEYLAGRTPSPCVWCNRHVKFRALAQVADEVDAAWIATGHYARTRVDDRSGRVDLLRGSDPARDQSYYLALLSQEDLRRVRFPMGDLGKERTRELARELGLSIADKSDSQDLCFVADDGYAALVRTRASDRVVSGEIVDSAGNVLGAHAGIVDFTVGQRRGLGIATGAPRYVTAIDALRARVIVGDERDLLSGGLDMDGANWIVDPVEARTLSLSCRIRYRHAGVSCSIEEAGAGRWRVRFASSQRAVTPGQAVVLYDGERVVCGGWIVGPAPGGEGA